MDPLTGLYIAPRRNADLADVWSPTLERLVLETLDLSFMATNLGWMVHCASTDYVMPGRIQE
eukprot:3416641-Alexandrium_andersonii.AAC.1